MMSFKTWLEMGFYKPQPNNTGDISRLPEIGRAGVQAYDDLPLGMKPMLTPVPSALPTYQVKKGKKRIKQK